MITVIRRWLWRLRGIFFLAPAAMTLAAVCLFVFLMQAVAGRVSFGFGYSYGDVLTSCFGLNWSLLSRGFVWQLVTYMFLHATWWHLGLNMLTVILFGSGLEVEVGGRRFWRIFLWGGVLGGVGWLVLTALMPWLPGMAALTRWLPEGIRHWFGAGNGAHATLQNSLCIGASGGVFALIGAYAALFPLREVYVLLLVVPVRMKARTLALLLGVLTVVEAMAVQSEIAYGAHLVGGLVGYLYGMRLNRLGIAGGR